MFLAVIVRSIQACILILSGASSMEELSEEKVDSYMYYHHHPLKINTAGETALMRGGLLSAYQAASIVDYRRRCGDILSPAELAAVDGIGGLYAEALLPFVSLETSRRPGESEMATLRTGAEVTARAQLQERDERTLGAYAGKARLTLEGPVEVTASVCGKAALSQMPLPPPGPPTFCASAALPSARLILGDFNLRFGQGAGLWSGFVIGGYPTLSSFCRNASGLSPSFSYESYHRGAGVDFRLRNCLITAAMSLPGLYERMSGDRHADICAMPVLAANWVWRRSQLCLNSSFTLSPQGSLVASYAAVDFKLSRGRFDFFCDCAGFAEPQKRINVVAGCLFNAGYQHRYGLIGRNLPKDRGVAAGAHYKTLDTVLDYSYNPKNGKTRLKYCLNWSSPREWPVGISARWQESGYPGGTAPVRSELRADAALALGRFRALARVDGLYNESFGMLSYLECGYESRALKLCLRGTFYDTSGWNDRIYCYETDVPGSFSVPAFYGRGWKALAVVSYRMQMRRLGRVDLCLRADSTPQMKFSVSVRI